MQKEMWFLEEQETDLEGRRLRRSWRALPTEEKNNDYRIGEHVRGRIYLGPEQFKQKEYPLVVTDVTVVKIGQTKPEDFRGSDMGSAEELKLEFHGYYKRPYTDDDEVRAVDFDYL